MVRKAAGSVVGFCRTSYFVQRSRDQAMLHLSRIALAFAVPLAASAVCAQDQPDLPAQAPFLRINAGMHTAAIRRIGVDASCTLLATASEDKTVRLWRLPSAQLVKTLRPPIGDGNEGKVNAVAVAPDATWVAAGGWTRTGGDHWVYVFDGHTGEMAARFGPFRQVIANLAVSADGRRLAATFWRGGGVRVWERKEPGIATWQLITEDSNYHGLDANGAAFAATGELFTVADDGQLRRYDLDNSRYPKVAPTRGGARPYSVSVSRIDNRLAVGFADRPVVDIYDPATLSWKLTSERSEGDAGSGGLAAVTWSANGDRLLAGGTYARGSNYVIRVWDDEGKGAPREIEGASDAIMHMLACGEHVAVASGTPAFGLLRSDGLRQMWRGPIGADMRNKLGQNFLISFDGRRVLFGLGEGGADPVLFELDAERLIDAPAGREGLFPAETGGLPISGWQNASRVRLGREPIGLDINERSQSLAIAPGRQQFVVGSDFFLRAFDKDGVLLWPRKQAPGVFWGVNISQDGHLIVAAAGDGTIRWYRMADGQELLALFVQRETRDWVAWTPKGYYMASPRGGDLIGWHVNRGWAQSADFFALSQFRDTYDRPDIVSRVLATLDEERAIDESNAFIQTKRGNEDVKKALPPVVAISSPASVTLPQDTQEVTIKYAVRTPSGLPVTRVFAMADGRPVPDAVTLNLRLNSNSEATGELKVKITPYSRIISIIAESDGLWSEPADLSIRRIDESALPNVKPRLYALIVGIGDYQKVMKLGNVPANDAEDIAAELKSQEGPDGAFDTVKMRILKDGDATRDNIVRGMQWLFNQAKDPVFDLALMYFSGHGVVIGGGSYLLPVNYDPDNLFLTGLSKTEIVQDLRAIPARVIFFVDACHAAADLYNRRARMLDTNGLLGEFSDPANSITAFASSQGTEVSRAAPGARNSYFTQALIDGLKGRAAPRVGNTHLDD